jgi:hypothetical protein
MPDFYAKGDRPSKEPIQVSIETDNNEVDIKLNSIIVASLVDDALELYSVSTTTLRSDYPELFTSDGYLKVRIAGLRTLLKP